MGRHADPDPRPFWHSLGGAVLRSLLGLAVVVGLLTALAAVGQPFGRLPIALDGPARTGPVAGDGPVMRSPAGTAVWILDAADDPSYAEEAGRRLAQRGFEVVGAGPADGDVAGAGSAEDGSTRTTVLFPPDEAEAARTLARGDERFSRIEGLGHDLELPQGVDLYVVVGDDWPG